MNVGTHVRPVVLLIPARNALNNAASMPRWMSVPKTANEIPDLEAAVKVLLGES